MKAKDILNKFLENADWIDRENTVDKIILGNPDKDIKNILVTWMSDKRAVDEAINGGFDMIMTHEPTFWSHRDELESMEGWGADSLMGKTGREKRKLIEENDIVILRNHDVWDGFPKYGIPWAWAEFLGLGSNPNAKGPKGHQHRYDIKPIAVYDLADRIAEKTTLLGEPVVQVFSNGNKTVSKIGIGTGCICKIEAFIKLGCDISIVCDDGQGYWKNIKWALDIGHPVIRVNHGTSEEPGMVKLTDYINNNFNGINAVHLPFKGGFKYIGC